MTWRIASLPLLAVVSLGCVLGQPRVKAKAPVITGTAAAPAPTPLASCSEAAPSEAAAFPPTPVVPLTKTSTELVTSCPEPVASAAPIDPGTPDPAPGTPILASGGAPALKYAALDGQSCLAELKKRKIPFTVATPSHGVDTPIRFAGKVHGIDVHGLEPPAKRATSVWEILDCRLALAIDDFAEILAKHDVVEAVHMSMYRPPPKNFKGKPARHDAALAIDLGFVVKKDGTRLRVLEDWHGGIGTKTCGKGAGPWPATKEGLELRQILCEAAESQLFNVVLTPNYNKPHANHFHLEVTRGVKWFLVH